MRRTRIEAVLDQLVAVYPSMLQLVGYGKDNCVLSCRVGADVLRTLGLRARPYACQVRVQNEPYFRAYMDGHEPQESEGAWSVDIGFGPPPGHEQDPHRIDAHAVLLVQQRYLLDLSIDQADRPQRNIRARPFWAEMTGDQRDGWRSGAPGYLHIETDGTHMLYRPTPERHAALMQAPDWTLRGKRDGTDGVAVIRGMTERILRELKQGSAR